MIEERQAVMINVPGGELLLLPNLAVREVVSLDRLRAAAGPDWLAGRCESDGHDLPVIRWEVLRGQPAAEDTRRTRITILNAIESDLESARYGLVTHGHPHLVTVNRAALSEVVAADVTADAMVSMRVRIANSTALIPDLKAVEGAIVAAQSDGH